MPPFDKEGFLGTEIEVYKRKLHKKYQNLFDFYRDLNRFLNELKFKITPKQSDNRGKTIALLFAKASETFQAIYILCENGLLADAEILNRALYESTVNLLYCSINEECHKNYAATLLAKKIESINYAIEKPEEFPNGFLEKVKGALPILRNKLLEDFGKKDNWKPPSVYKKAKDTGIVGLYQTFYHLVSETVHSNAASLERYIYLDEENTFKKILWGPRDKEIDIQLFTSIECVEYLCGGLRQYFGQPKEEEMVRFKKRKEEIWKAREPD